MDDQKNAYKIVASFYHDFFDLQGDTMFKYVAIMFGALAATNMATAFFTNDALGGFAASSKQWWGDITSLALYDTIGSIVGLLLAILLFALVNSRLDKHVRESRSFLFSFCPIFSAIMANIIWTSVPAHAYSATYGSSGACVAADGFLMIISFSNLIQIWRPNGKLTIKVHFSDSFEKKFWIIVNLFVVVSMLAYPLVLQPVYIPSEEVNMFVHRICLFLGLAAGLAYLGTEYLQTKLFQPLQTSLYVRED